MLRVGERSGNMGEMMERIAAFYDEELSRFVDVATRLIEPAMMTVIGLVIASSSCSCTSRSSSLREHPMSVAREPKPPHRDRSQPGPEELERLTERAEAPAEARLSPRFRLAGSRTSSGAGRRGPRERRGRLLKSWTPWTS